MVGHMLAHVNPLENAAVVRLLEFLSDQRPWYRSLWGIGVVLAMDELYEGCAAMRQGHLSEASVKRVAVSLQKRVGAHPAFNEAEKALLRQQVQQIPRAEGASHFGIRELSAQVSSDYLSRWGRAVASGKFTVEHFARNVAAHLLDAGFAARYLHDFVKARLDSPARISLPELCEALQAEMRASPRREFNVLLAYTTKPDLLNGIPASWLRGAAVVDWLRARGFDTAGVRSPAALVLRVLARDPIGAAQAARSESDRYTARALIATGERLNPVPWLWVEGSQSPAAMKEDSRGVSVRELYREDRVFSASANQSVDAALELLAHLEASSPPAAVAGGWGAIEGLLADPSDRASAADNLATLVTCSFPRAELTRLSYRLASTHPEQRTELERAPTNRERCRILAQMIVDRRMPEMRSVSDQAAVARIKKLLSNPGPELQTIRDAIGESFHRLYRQRNLILHGGRLDSVALTANLRTVAKLAGAGMDRITHGHYVQNLKPLELVAKANLALAMVSREFPLGCVDLLEAAD
ncbi:integrase [Massilia arenae]|nr:integrase [Massilia arenae]